MQIPGQFWMQINSKGSLSGEPFSLWVSIMRAAYALPIPRENAWLVWLLNVRYKYATTFTGDHHEKA
jgi:hypothetical protein